MNFFHKNCSFYNFSNINLKFSLYLQHEAYIPQIRFIKHFI